MERILQSAFLTDTEKGELYGYLVICVPEELPAVKMIPETISEESFADLVRHIPRIGLERFRKENSIQYNIEKLFSFAAEYVSSFSITSSPTSNPSQNDICPSLDDSSMDLDYSMSPSSEPLLHKKYL